MTKLSSPDISRELRFRGAQALLFLGFILLACGPLQAVSDLPYVPPDKTPTTLGTAADRVLEKVDKKGSQIPAVGAPFSVERKNLESQFGGVITGTQKAIEQKQREVKDAQRRSNQGSGQLNDALEKASKGFSK